MSIILPKFNPAFETKELNITEEQYHGMKEAVHYSSLKHMMKSPHTYMWYMKNPIQPTRAMKFGTLAHKAILEGRDFLENYVIEPIFEGYTKSGELTTSPNATSVKQKKYEWYQSLKPNIRVVTKEEYDSLGFMMESLLSHQFIRDVLKDGRPEVRGQWLDEPTGIGCVFAQDFLTYDLSLQADVKTCRDSSDISFARDVERQKYYLQDSMYSIGSEKVFCKKPKTRLWIAIENCEPWETRIHYVSEIYQDAGEYEFRKNMTKLKNCITSNSWPQAQTVVEAIDPSYLFKEHYKTVLNLES